MLTVELHTISHDKSIEAVLHMQGFRKQGEKYNYTNNNVQIEGVIDFYKRMLEINFSPLFNLKEYTEVHLLVKKLIKDLNTQYNDSQSLLGYLSNGSPAYILTNWEHWVIFLQEAKLRSLKGKKVRVFDEANTELDSGMFVSYTTAVQSSNITECTVITLFGERSITGSKLSIEATNEW